MTRLRRLPRSIRLSLILAALGLGVVTYAWAQGVGIFSRAVCTTLTAPVVGQTFCFDQTANVLKYWDGTSWIAGFPPQSATVSVKDYGAKGDGRSNTNAGADGSMTTGTASLRSVNI